MTMIHRRLIGMTFAMLLPLPAVAQRVSYDVGKGDFGSLKTFAFTDGSTADNKTQATTAYDSPLITARTQAAIAAQLESHGLKRNDEHPDMYVTARRTFKTDYTVYGLYDWGGGYGWGSGWGSGWGLGWGPYYTGWSPWYGSNSYSIDERIVGTLVVDVQNAATGELMWRGLAEQHVHEHSSPENRTKRVKEEVAKMFEKFPA